VTTSTTDDLFDPPSLPPGATEEDGVRRDRYGRYLLPHPTSGREAPWTRVTTFAKTISDTYTLNMWGRRMSVKGLTMRPDLYALAASTSLDNRDALNKIAEQAAEVAGSKTAASLGTALHSFTEVYDRGEDPQVPSPWDADVRAYAAALEAEGLAVVPDLIERIVLCQRYSVAGTFDRVFRVTRPHVVEIGDWAFGLEPGELVMGDLKTGRDLSYGWGEIAVQLALYANADRMWDPADRVHRAMPEVRKDVAVVVHLPVGQAKATVYDVDIAAGWQAAELCAQVRNWRKVQGLAVPRLAATVTPSGAVAVEVPPELADRIATARTFADLSAIWREVTVEGTRPEAWTPALAALGATRRAAIITETAGG